MASHSARRRQIVEKDFSPPDNVFVWRPLSLLLVMSGSTWKNQLAWSYGNDPKPYTLISRNFAIGLISRWPRKFLSLSKYVKVIRARLEIKRLNFSQRSCRSIIEVLRPFQKSVSKEYRIITLYTYMDKIVQVLDLLDSFRVIEFCIYTSSRQFLLRSTKPKRSAKNYARFHFTYSLSPLRKSRPNLSYFFSKLS